MKTTEQKTEKTQKKPKNRRRLSGTVVSNKMKDTIVVSVARYVKHPKYKKFMRRMKKYMAHDAGNAHEIGEKVQIEERSPMSKRKHFEVVDSQQSSVNRKEDVDQTND